PCLSPAGLLTLPMAAGARQVPPVSGSPLSDTEYQKFFSRLKPVQEANLFCLMRQAYGCTNPTILRLDRDENHGQIPDGPVCTDVPEVLQFETFCQFAQYRCIKQQFYTKMPTPSPKVPTPSPKVPTHSPKVPTPSQKNRTTVLPTTVLVPAATTASPPKVESPEHESLKNSIWQLINSALSLDASLTTVNSSWNFTKSHLESTSEPEVVPRGRPQESSSSCVPHPGPLTCSQMHTHTHLPIASALHGQKYTYTYTYKPCRYPHSPMQFSQESKVSLGRGFFAMLWGCFTLFQFLTKGVLTSFFPLSVSLLALRNDEAVTILCYAVLEGNCLSSMLAMAWKEMEKRIFGFGDSVCDNLGRRHMDLCPDCAFCSLKREQCQNIKTLNRVHCNTGDFSTYINPQISAQHQDAENKSSSSETLEDYDMGLFGGLKSEYWCSRMAIHGCEDPNVTLWLEAEYTVFPDRGTRSEICDSSGVQHPSYCMFKSHQCLQESTHNQRVTRVECNNNETYQVLSAKEGEKEVQLWREKFLSLAKQ
ncbi:ACRBP protein, partial [Smithornis capensis]|nr:ACRBP protein [Smithornis capensis]